MPVLPPIPIVGMRFRGPEIPLWVAAYGEGRELALLPEPTNPYDPNAIKVIDPEGPEGTPCHVGYIPRGMAGLIAAGLAAGQTVASCTVISGALLEIVLEDPE